MLEMHHQPNRWDFYRRANPITWDHGLNCWCVFDPKINCRHFKEHPISRRGLPLRRPKYYGTDGIDLSFTKLLFEEIPLANEGEKHTALRRRMAQAIADREESASELFRLRLVELGARITSFGKPVNLTDEFFIPLVDSFINGLVGSSNVQRFVTDSISFVFGRTLSLNRRKTIDAQISQLVNWLGQTDELHGSAGSRARTHGPWQRLARSVR